ncbi:MAG: hypothetical protein J7K21_00565 [Desulfurococcales archaeon]|nr:hypothetical protein [Desulfurococcales archaeon]
MSEGIQKPILFIGSKPLVLIGLASGFDSIEVYSNECRLPEHFGEKIRIYGAVIVDEEVYSSCPELKKIIDDIEEHILVIKVPPPARAIGVEPKRYYEELVSKFVGLKIRLTK